MWLFTDGLFSWILYLRQPTWDGQKRQTFWGDHWVRLVRILVGIFLMVAGALL